MSSWEPIETAPMDGTEIIGVYVRKYDFQEKPTICGPWTVAWCARRKKWMASWDGMSVIYSESYAGTEYKEPDMDPTHWMSKPEPPAHD